jgi:hypothetical protein
VKTQLNTPQIISQGFDSSSVSMMDMDLDGMKQACQIFRDNIYSNKIRAVVREWICNAVDEHVKFSIEKPILVEINEGKFSVRDFAKGLSDDGVRNVFGKYFRSTKSHNNQAIGGFGVGAKAGHCYNDCFFVTSFFEGVKTIYSCVLGGDESGASIGQVFEISKEPTEQTGLLVEIDIQDNNDVKSFMKESKCLANTMTRANINLCFDKIEQILLNRKLIEERDGVKLYSLESSNAFINELEHLGIDKGTFLVTMGGVYYELPPINIDDLFILSDYSFCKKGYFQIDVPVGYFDIPISREKFRDVPKFRNEFLKAVKILIDLEEKESRSVQRNDFLYFLFNEKIFTENFEFGRNCFLSSKKACFFNKIHYFGNKSSVFRDKDKVVIFTVSDKLKTRLSQIEKIRKFGEEKNVLLIYIIGSYVDDLTNQLAINGLDGQVVFKNPRCIFPKNASSSKKENVCQFTETLFAYKNKRINESRTLLYFCRFYLKENFASIEEVRSFLSEKKKNISFLKDLDSISIKDGNKVGEFLFYSKKAAPLLESLGFVNKLTDEYQHIRKPLVNIQMQVQGKRLTLDVKIKSFRKYISHSSKSIISKKLDEVFYSSKFTPDLIKKLEKLEKSVNSLYDTLQTILKKSKSDQIISLFMRELEHQNYINLSRGEVRQIFRKLLTLQ